MPTASSKSGFFFLAHGLAWHSHKCHAFFMATFMTTDGLMSQAQNTQERMRAIVL
jgi:hypothetical protein